MSADEVPGSPPALTVPSDSELGRAGDRTEDEDATTDADAATDDPAATDESAAPGRAGRRRDGGTTVPRSRRPRCRTTRRPRRPAAPEEAPTEQFDSFCEQNVGAC